MPACDKSLETSVLPLIACTIKQVLCFGTLKAPVKLLSEFSDYGCAEISLTWEYIFRGLSYSNVFEIWYECSTWSTASVADSQPSSQQLDSCVIVGFFSLFVVFFLI